LVEVGVTGGAGGVAAAGGEDGEAVADEALHERLVLLPVHASVLGAVAVDDGDRDGAHGPISYRRGAPGQPRPGSGAPQWRASHPRGRPPPPAALDAGAFADRRLRGSDDSDASDVVVQLELVRVRAEAERIDLRGALELDPGHDQVLGEHIALG